MESISEDRRCSLLLLLTVSTNSWTGGSRCRGVVVRRLGVTIDEAAAFLFGRPTGRLTKASVAPTSNSRNVATFMVTLQCVFIR